MAVPESRTEAILRAGTEIAGPAAAAAGGLLVGGPVGAVVGAAAASPATLALRGVLGELAGRVLGGREERRVGAVLLEAEAEIRFQLDAGRALRSDGLFGDGATRSGAEEIAEAAVLAAQRDPQEAKAPLIGKMLGRLQFETRVAIPYAHLLIREAGALTYRQLCCLVLFNLNIRDQFSLPDGSGDLSDTLNPKIRLLQEILDLYQLVSGFPYSAQQVPQDGTPASAEAVMGPYYPQVAQCSVSTFTAGGVSACFAASG